MLYVIYRPTDCPNMFAYPYVWYWVRYFYKLYMFTKFNYKSIRFGRLLEFIKLIFTNVVHGTKLITIEWDTIWFDKYDRYMSIINVK